MRVRSLVASLGSLLAMVGVMPMFTSVADARTRALATGAHSTYVAPLLGTPDPRGVTRSRAALTIKIDNTPQAIPQVGIQDADVVYEEIVEGDITRLAAIFNSRTPRVVGPIRSIRRTDREIVFPLGGLFVASGGAEYALRSIATAPVHLYDEANSGSMMFRDPQRPPPHNLFVNASAVMKRFARPRPTHALFSYLKPGEQFAGPRVRSFVVGYGAGYAVTYSWNATTKSWDRSLFGEPDVSANGVRISPKNVIVMSVNYVGGVGVLDSYAQLIGSGPVQVFVDGRLERGYWHRSRLSQTTSYVNLNGHPIHLQPGRTWVELMASTQKVSITP